MIEAATVPAGPAPMTKTSNFSILIYAFNGFKLQLRLSRVGLLDQALCCFPIRKKIRVSQL